MSRYLTDEDAHKVCKLLEDGYSNKEIGDKFNVRYSVINAIRQGLTYKEISKDYDIKPIENPRSYRLSKESVHRVCLLIEEGYNTTEVSEMTNVSRRSVYNIRMGNIYSDISSQYNVSDLMYENKLDEDEVKNICKLLEDGYSNKEISDMSGVSSCAIAAIRRGSTYREITKDYNIKPYVRGRLDEETVHRVCRLMEHGFRNSDIAIYCNLDDDIVSDIRNGEAYKEISKKYNIERMTRCGKINEEIMYKICSMKENGVAVKSISEELDIGTTAIYRALKIPKFEHIRRQYNL